MADERKVYTITVDFTKGYTGSDANLVEAYAEFKRHCKERLTRDLPAKRGAQIAELVSITEA